MSATSEIPPSQRPSIQSLPHEILLMIFIEVYFKAREDDRRVSKHFRRSRRCLSVIGDVCKLWRDLSLRLPHLWQRIRIYVDEPISLPQLKAKLTVSSTFSFDMFVVRKQLPIHAEDDSASIEQPEKLPTGQELDPNERDRVISLLPLVARHLHRCDVLVFDLLLRSSLPCLTNFCGEAAHLRTLRLRSKHVDSMNNGPPIPEQVNMFRCSYLRYLDFDGGIFVRAVQIPQWQDSMRSLHKKHISITNLFSGDYGDFDLCDLVMSLSEPKIGHITRFQLSNIHLDHQTCYTHDPVSIFIQNFMFEDLPYDTLAGFFMIQLNIIDVTSLVIRRCDLGPGPVISFSSRRLLLEDIHETENITAFVQNWDGFALEIKQCPSVNNSLLQMMVTLEHEKMESYFVPSVRQITISPFLNISPFGVRNLVVARAEQAKKFNPADGVPKYFPMHSIWLVGAGPPLSHKDREWFKEALEGFCWYTLRAGFESPVLGSDCSTWEIPQDVSSPVILFLKGSLTISLLL